MLVFPLRFMEGLGPTAFWTVVFFAAVIAVFVGYVGIALWGIYHAPPGQEWVRYRVFRDLLDLFRRGGTR